MFSNCHHTTIAIRNYTLAALTVITLSCGVGELFNSPNRIATQNTIDNYSSVIGAGLVSYAQSNLK